MYYVYLLESNQDKSWYVGFTPDSPQRRLSKHNAGLVYYTKRKLPWRLIYYEAYLLEKDATGREKFLKSGSGRNYVKHQLKNYLSLPQSKSGELNKQGLPCGSRSELYAAPSSSPV